MLIWPVVLFIVTGNAHAGAEGFPVMGLTKDRKEVVKVVPKDEYVRLMRGMVGTVNDSTLPALERQQQGSQWLLREVIVGLGLTLEAGLGPIWSVSVTPRILMVFSNSTEPYLP